MKKFLILALAAMTMASCTTIKKSATVAKAPCGVYHATIADLEVSPERISYTYTPSSEVRRGGVKNCINAAVQEALTSYGNADLMIDLETVITTYSGLFTHNKVKQVKVTGRPAFYKNFRNVDDSVWCNSAFRLGEQNCIVK